ncbi:FtsX-like permease family protein [Paenibacillus validus]|nr:MULTISPECIES: FtsX-like permease family protein [Paenibacillus]MED4600071.1 FtsX-like permease family protein [Paenibacillus validus]MED4605662.1 FtsX-like permease family protein [Paenibacillus validus]NTZ20688.1 FtsX-like permease family protein [Paenibacillus sp. JMULE4]
MLSPRLRKMLRDLRIAKGRMVMMVLSIAVGIFGIGTILSAYTILTREMSLNYQSTNPASAFLELDHIDKSLLDGVRNRPGIAGAEATAWVEARVEVRPQEWKPLLIFGVEDFKSMRISTFRPESGAWPPSEGSILLERTALQLLKAKIGDAPRIQTPDGQKLNVAITGTVHDPSLAPSWQEQTAYGYAAPSTLALLGETDAFHILKVLVKDQPMNSQAIERTIGELAVWLKQQGHKVGEIRIPPPGKHPHQSQMTAILIMLLIFSLLALTLSAILIATMIGGLLAGQIRQIGVMKAIGARTSQIAALYLLLIMLVGFAAVLLGMPTGIAAGRGFAVTVAELLNFTLYSDSIPLWNYVVLLLAGILVPFLTALVPIWRATRITVREAINDFGTSRKSFGSKRLDIWLGKIRGLDRTLILALRNTFRRRGRLLLTLSLLAAAGGMFMTSLNVRTGWESILSDAVSNRHYDLEIRLNRPEAEHRIIQILQSIPEVRHVEAWNREPAAAIRTDGLDIIRTYPDGGHGSFTLRSVPADTETVELPLLKGRWLRSGDSDNAVVLNHNAHALFPEVNLGDPLSLAINGNPVQLQVVGIVRENLSPAAAYVSPSGYTKAVGLSGQTNALRVALKDPGTVDRVQQEIERVLEKENVRVEAVISETMLNEAVSGHVYILIFALILMSVIMAVVGALGLMSSMGTNVVERTREFGIMRTIGGRSRTVLRNVVSEGIFIGLMSWVIALVISLPVSAAVGNLIGNLAFRSPLPLVSSPTAILIWLVIIIIGSATASVYPAWKASRLTIRDTLDYI